MGLDGGTYITRSDVLRGQSWKLASADTSRSTRGGDASTSTVRDTADPRDVRSTKWSTCSLTNQPLQDPIVADNLGNLYNREAVLEFLLAKNGAFVDDLAQHRYINQQRVSKFGYEHLQSSRDVFTVHMSGASDGCEAHCPVSADVESAARFICPITHLSCMRYPFVAISKCGHVLSERAVKQASFKLACRDGCSGVKHTVAGTICKRNNHCCSVRPTVSESCCPICNTRFSAASLIPINGTAEQVQALTKALASRKMRSQTKGKRKRGSTP